MTIHKRWFGDAFIKKAQERSTSIARGHEIVAEVRNGGVHHLGKRTLRESLTFELREWVVNEEGKRKLVYVMVKLTNYANGVMDHYYSDSGQPSALWEVAKVASKSWVERNLTVFGVVLESTPMPGVGARSLLEVSED
jgi:hypothetical protein